MENLNAEQVKKGLECHANGCKCSQCPMPKRTKEHHLCWTELSKATLALINSQEQRIKELTEENERLRAENEALAISEVKECEISQMLVYRIRDKHPAVMAVIADTVRKMQESLHKRFGYDKSRVHTDYNVHRYIDQIAKEMLEGEK